MKDEYHRNGHDHFAYPKGNGVEDETIKKSHLAGLAGHALGLGTIQRVVRDPARPSAGEVDHVPSENGYSRPEPHQQRREVKRPLVPLKLGVREVELNDEEVVHAKGGVVHVGRSPRPLVQEPLGATGERVPRRSEDEVARRVGRHGPRRQERDDERKEYVRDRQSQDDSVGNLRSPLLRGEDVVGEECRSPQGNETSDLGSDRHGYLHWRG
mmetsp:Transcript_26909/g.57223  ORF Transcript_26909/g.57223 Transcript_26909/m.57223 type:complete len:212 (+) Transcript_26909:523-1158(+)